MKETSGLVPLVCSVYNKSFILHTYGLWLLYLFTMLVFNLIYSLILFFKSFIRHQKVVRFYGFFLTLKKINQLKNDNKELFFASLKPCRRWNFLTFETFSLHCCQCVWRHPNVSSNTSFTLLFNYYLLTNDSWIHGRWILIFSFLPDNVRQTRRIKLPSRLLWA